MSHLRKYAVLLVGFISFAHRHLRIMCVCSLNRWAYVQTEGERDGRSEAVSLYGGPQLEDIHVRERRHHQLSV